MAVQLGILRCAATVCFTLVVAILSVGSASASDTTLESALSTHVMNMTLSGALTGWPDSTEGLAVVTTAATTTMCAQLPATVQGCTAFLIRVRNGFLALQMSAQTFTVADASATYTTLSTWASGGGDPPLTALRDAAATALGVASTDLDRLAYENGDYRMPCRSPAVYDFLPVCQADEVPQSEVYVLNATGTAPADYIRASICVGAADCSNVNVNTVAPVVAGGFTMVNITGAGSALDAILAYVAAVRAGTEAQAAIVQMRYDGMTATLYSNTETQRYGSELAPTVVCSATEGLWALAFIAIPVLCVIVYHLVYRRGRRRTKKRQRRLIHDDELRIMQRYANLSGDGDGGAGMDGGYGGTAADGTEPPPGMGFQRSYSQAAGTGGTGGTVWMMDGDGNYYEVPADQYGAGADAGEANAGGEDGQGADGVTYQTYVDPESGEVYQYEASANGAAAEEQAGAGTQYQTYVDPETGEMYQYGPNAVETAEGEHPEELQTYVDPETGETYQYDPNAATAETAETELQTYVDPDTGEEYQYDPNAAAAEEGELQTYVDPDTGEEYQYDPNAAVADEGELQTYVDPETGETYQYGPNAVAE